MHRPRAILWGRPTGRSHAATCLIEQCLFSIRLHLWRSLSILSPFDFVLFSKEPVGLEFTDFQQKGLSLTCQLVQGQFLLKSSLEMPMNEKQRQALYGTAIGSWLASLRDLGLKTL